MKIGIIPLDERPVNTRYPVLLTHGTDVQVILPPPSILSTLRQPANAPALAAWLEAQAPHLDALIVSVEMLGYGGLIASRISDDPLETILARLALLRRLKQRHPALKIYGFNVITRISRHNDNTEEPVYWGQYGTDLFRLSQLTDRLHRVPNEADVIQAEHDALIATLPAAVIADFVSRRLRNHAVNLQAVNLLQSGVFDVLVLSSDDTSPDGFGSAEKQWLHNWVARLGLAQPVDNLLMYPGADEVGCVLLARLINEAKGAPTFEVRYLDAPSAEIIAAFEDVPVQVTVARQLHAAGAHATTDKSDDNAVLLLINPPLSPDADWVRDYTPDEERQRRPSLDALATTLAQEKKQIAVADVAHSNGADAALLPVLIAAGWDRLSAYSGWNTAGNSIGTTIAAACLSYHYGVNRLFLAHRLIEDYGYQTLVRNAANDWLESETGNRDPEDDGTVEQVRQWIETALHHEVARLPIPYEIRNVRLPWRRTFEVDFDLEPVNL